MVEVILLAGGSGTRMGVAAADKILTPIAGKSAFRRCLEAFRAAGLADRIVVVTRDTAQEKALEAEASDLGQVLHCVRGGKERQNSVCNGLAATTPGSHLVFIHDCARALIQPESLQLVAAAAARDGAAVLARPVSDTIKRVPGSIDGLSQIPLEDLDRRSLWAMETPQVFRRDWIHHAYKNLTQAVTDDVAVAVAAGHGVTIVPNPHPNPKLTHPEDLSFCSWLLERNPPPTS